MSQPSSPPGPGLGARITRRRLLSRSAALLAAPALLHAACGRGAETAVVIVRAPSYGIDIASLLVEALREIGIGAEQIRGTSVLLKPNLVETSRGKEHINTHPLVVRGAFEAFRRLGASRVVVGEGAGHRRDSFLVLEESGMAEVLTEDSVPFVDLNYDDVFDLANAGRRTGMPTLTFPSTLRQVDWIVSMPKLKTHHWVGATLSMKNLFGVMPGTHYGWPKNVLHMHGVEHSIVDITATLTSHLRHLAIADGIVGMEGDGPIMGTPRPVGALVVGTNLPAVDATCARIMDLRAERIPYLADAAGWLGPIATRRIEQRGEEVAAVRTPFALLESIPSQRVLR